MPSGTIPGAPEEVDLASGEQRRAQINRSDDVAPMNAESDLGAMQRTTVDVRHTGVQRVGPNALTREMGDVRSPIGSIHHGRGKENEQIDSDLVNIGQDNVIISKEYLQELEAKLQRFYEGNNDGSISDNNSEIRFAGKSYYSKYDQRLDVGQPRRVEVEERDARTSYSKGSYQTSNAQVQRDRLNDEISSCGKELRSMGRPRAEKQVRQESNHGFISKPHNSPDSDSSDGSVHTTGTKSAGGKYSAHRYVTNRARRPKREWIHVDRFDGNGQWNAFITRFKLASKYNVWDEQDNLAHLQASLKGTAEQVLWIEGDWDWTFEDLVSKLTQRNGSKGKSGQYRCELAARRREKGESLLSFFTAISGLISQAYEGPHSQHTDAFAVDAFLKGLNDADISLKIRELEPETLDEAYQHAVRFESYREVDKGNRNFDDHRNRRDRQDNHFRGINQATENQEKNELQKLMAEIRDLKQENERLKNSVRPISELNPRPI